LLQMALTTRLQNESAEARDISDRWLRTATGSSLLTGALGLAGGVVGQWQRANRAHISAAYSQGKRAIFLKSISRTVRIGSQIALYGVGAWLVVKAEIAPGALVASAILLARALAPIEGLAQSIKTIRTAFAAYGQLKALPEDAETASFGDRQSASGAIGLRDVTYYHPQRKTAALRGISLTLATSECVGIVGPNGAGKSTLAAMLAGAIIPTAGVADLDGVAIAKWQRDPGDTPIGYVGDEPLLLEGTVHANIARFRDVALLSVARAAMRAGVHDILQGLEQGYDTPVGQSGTGLALRERRAVAFARALCGTPRVVIFDEPELGLDGAAVKKLIGTLQALKSEGVGLIVVTQDPRLIEIMDRVVVIANGTIQATGPAAEFSRPQGPRVVRPVEAQKGQS
ncbi:MAG: ATP-binding cassette domain-containing protein, partial [Hyphomicrobium sp.]